jgi:hypothetical protein
LGFVYGKIKKRGKLITEDDNLGMTFIVVYL